MVLIEKLIEKKIITPEKAEELRKEFDDFEGTEEDFYLIKKIISEDNLNKIRSEFYGIDVFNENEGFEIPNNILSLIPEESALFYKIIPLRVVEDTLEVGMVDSEDIKAKEAINFITRQKRLKFKIYLLNKRLFDAYIKKYRNITEEVGRALSALETEIGGVDDGVEIFSFDPKTNKEKLSEEAPIIKMVAVILRHAVDGNASDVHIEPEEKQLRIRFRMDGTLYSSLFLPLHTHPSIVARIKILSNLRIDENRIPQDGRFSARIDNKNIDFRVSTFPTKLGEKVVIRVLDPNEGLKSYQDIGLISNNLRLVREAIKRPFGMILATGPTGSGKTTTLYSILQELNKPEVNVVTLEDPIEYYVPGINQSQIRPEIGYDFSQGLRHVVRQDPDIIMVGEIRDEESASLATQAALTGHIVLSTLHTNNAIGIIPRLIDMKIKPFLLPATLNIGIAQRLSHRLCPFCKEKVRPLKELEKMIVSELSLLPEQVKREVKIPEIIYVYKPKGCPKCNNKGEKGRLGIFEVLKMTPDLEKIIVEDPTELKISAEVKRQGMISMRQDGIIKAINGDISIEEVFRVSEE